MTGKLIVDPIKGLNIDGVVAKFIDDIKNDNEFEPSFQYITKKREQLEKFIKRGKSPVKGPKYRLVVLRKFNSYTPILPPANNEYENKGGGYFLRIEKIGIVIDPGYNFVENFLKAGYKLDDIDHIFISHAHNDHTVELESIFALLYKRNKAARTRKKKIKLYMNLGSFKKFAGYFDLSTEIKENYIDEITLLNKHQMIKITDDIGVFTSQTKHHEMITKNYALGFTFKINIQGMDSRIIKFTCDTGWSSEIEKANKIECEDNHKIDKTDVLVAHIGSIKEKELKYDTTKTLKENEKKNKLYGHHLGLIGCAAQINFWRPQIALLSEFGEELDEIREKISEKFQSALNVSVLPTDINFCLDIETLQIKCFKSQKFFKDKDINVSNHKGQLYYYNEAELTAIEKANITNHLGNTIKAFY